MAPRRRSVRRRNGGRRSGRRVLQAGPLFRAAARVGANAVRNWRRVQPVSKAVIGGSAAGAAGIGAYRSGYRSAALAKKRASRMKRGSYGGEFGVTTKMIGRVGKGRKFPRRQLKLGYQKVVSRWQRVSPMTDASDTVPPGSLMLSHATILTDKTSVPMHMFLLNQTQNGTVPYVNGPMFRASFNDTGGLELITDQSQAATGSLAVDGNWQPEVYDPELLGENMRYIMAAWYDIRIQAYGCTAQPTVYDIMIVQFTSAYLDPLETPSNAQEVADRHSVYQGMVQKYMSSPIMPVIVGRQKYRVLKRVRFTLQSTKTDENDKDPNCRQVKMFMRDGNLYDYRYHDDGFGGAGADNKLSTTQWAVQGAVTADYSNVPHPRARKWLIIRAMNTRRQSTSGEITVANTPSYNIIVRKAEYQKNGN